MKAIVVGYGGIGKNTYVPQLEKLGYSVDVVDPYAIFAEYQDVKHVPKSNKYDVAIICCPNNYHLEAILELTDVCNTIMVEKPGVANTKAWLNLLHKFPNHKIVLVKNNLYRKNIETFESLINDIEDVAKVDINWLNKDRIPSPGSWFTDKSKAFGGVTHDLFPHLYCFMFMLFSFHIYKNVLPKTFKMQRWNLNNISGSTDYGEVNLGGTYDVCDYAEAHYLLPRDESEPLPVTLRASWKEGYDDQGIHVYYKDGGHCYQPFGFCPNEAYGEMIKATVEGRFMQHYEFTWVEQDFDKWIHAHLEQF